MFGTISPNDSYNVFFDDMANHISNSKKSDGCKFHAGLFVIVNTADEKIYLAEEYPYHGESEGHFSQERQRYLDALLGMIITDVSDDTDLLIISHDRDWGRSVDCVISQQELKSYEKMRNLKKLLDKVKTISVICFQHDEEHSNVYNTIKDNIKNASSLFTKSSSWGKSEDILSLFNGTKNIDDIEDLTDSLPPSVSIPDDDFNFEEL